MVPNAKCFVCHFIQYDISNRMVPNAEHSLAGHETSVMFAIRAFYLSVVDVSRLIVCSNGH